MPATVANLLSQLTIRIAAPSAAAVTQLSNLATTLGSLDKAINKIDTTLKSKTITTSLNTALGNFNKFKVGAVADFELVGKAVATMTAEIVAAGAAMSAAGGKMAGAARRVAVGVGGGGAGGGRRGGVGGGGGGGVIVPLRRGSGTTAGGGTGSGAFSSIAGSFVGMMVGGAILGGISTFLSKSMEMETALAQLQALTRANTEEMGKYSAKIMEVSGLTPYGPAEIADAMLRLQRATGSSTAALGMLRVTANLALASFGKVSLEGAADFLGQLSKTFPGGAAQAERYAKSIATLSLSMGVGMEAYTRPGIAGQLATAAARSGAGGPESTLKLFTLGVRQLGVSKAQQMGTAMERLAGEMKTPHAQAALAKLGVKPTSDLNELVVRLYERMQTGPGAKAEVMEALQSGMGTPPTVGGKKAGTYRGAAAGVGERSIKGLLYPLMQLETGWKGVNGQWVRGRQASEDMNKQLADQRDLIKEISDRRLNTLAGQLELMKENLGKVAMTIGDVISPATRGLIEGLGALSNKFTDLYASSRLFHNVIQSLGKTAITGGALFAFVAVLKGAFGLLKNVSGFVGATTLVKFVRGAAAGLVARASLPAIAAAGAGSTGLGGITGAMFGNVAPGALSTMAFGIGKAAIGFASTAGTLLLIYGAIRVISEVISMWSMGWTKWAAEKRGGTYRTALTSGAGGMLLELGLRPKKVFSEADVTVLEEALRKKFGKGLGEMTSPYEKKWLQWFVENYEAVINKGIRERVQAHSTEMNNLAKHAELLQREANIQKEMNDTYAFGFEKMNKLMTEAKGLATYEPPVMKWGTQYATTKMLEKLQGKKGVGSHLQRAITRSLVGGEEAEAILAEEAEGIASPARHAKLTHLLMRRQSTLSRLESLGLLRKGTSKTFGKNVLGPAAAATDPANLLATGYQNIESEGEWKKGRFIPGYEEQERSELYEGQSLFKNPPLLDLATGLPRKMTQAEQITESIQRLSDALLKQLQAAENARKSATNDAVIRGIEKALHAFYKNEVVRVRVEPEDALTAVRRGLDRITGPHLGD